MLKTINELSKNAQFKAMEEFKKFATEMEHDASHTFEEFSETSNANNWKYKDDGTFVC